MKVIHTFTDKWGIISKELIYIQLLSAILAKRHYGNISFYGNQATVDRVKMLPFQYDEYVVIDDFDYNKTFSHSKLVTYSLQQEEFLHIDTDTLLFNKIDFNQYASPSVFGYPDRDDYLSTENTVNTLTTLLQKNPFATHSPDESTNGMIEFLFGTYLQLFFKIEQEPDLRTYLDIQSIPNMNIFYSKEPELVSVAADKALQHYYSNQNHIDDHDYGACYIEQLTFNTYLRHLSEDYRTESTHMRHTVFNNEPFNHDYSKNIEPRAIEDWKFPYDIKISSLCNHCRTHHNVVKTVESKEQIKQLIDYDFGGYWHITYYKYSDAYQAVVIGKLLKELGDINIRIIHDLYTEWYKYTDQPQISSGELFFEELTGNKIFSNGKSI